MPVKLSLIAKFSLRRFQIVSLADEQLMCPEGGAVFAL
jgi:hypothetical protein